LYNGSPLHQLPFFLHLSHTYTLVSWNSGVYTPNYTTSHTTRLQS
jgi:hypothetical protein